MGVPVSAILERKGHEVITTSPQATIEEVARALNDHRVGALVVTDEQGGVEGIVSERDVVEQLARDGPAALQASVAAAMTRQVTTCTPATGVPELAATMTEGRIRHLPVVEHGRLVGIVSIGDVVKSRLDELATQTESLERYVTGTAY